MRIMHVNISALGFRDISQNANRFQLIVNLLVICKNRSVDLLVLPAGVVTCTQEHELEILVKRLENIAKQYGVNIIGGIDTEKAAYLNLQSKSNENIDRLIKRGEFPAFGFAVGRSISGIEDNVWRQACTRSVHDDFDIDTGGKLIKLKNKLIGVFICGELFSKKARKKIAESLPHIILDIGHLGMGQGIIPAFKGLAKKIGTKNNNKPIIFHSQHVKNWGGKILKVSASGDNLSTFVDEKLCVVQGVIWAAYNIEKAG